MESYEKNPKCDLHIHSNYSDGTDAPSEIVKKAMEEGIGAIALTDHNTIEGLDEFISEASKYDINIAPGIEFSTEYGNHELHIIGLFINKNSYEHINRFLEKAQKAKKESNKQLIDNLIKAGYDVSYKELEVFASTNNINRAVIGQYLLSKGIISSVEQGFKTILSKKAGYYIPPKRPSTIDTIKFIKSIGAVAVLAHPLLDLSYDELIQFLPIAKESGIDAIEAYYSSFTDEQQELLLKVAKENNLLVSGGSDYHGIGKPHISLGKGTGNLYVPFEVYLELLKNSSK